MDYDRAKQIGNRGELQVAAVLDNMSAKYGFIVLHDVLLEKRTKTGAITAQLDHVIVDRAGLLIIETKVRNALLMGTNVDSKWTAVYRTGLKKPFQNPLRQNDAHIGTTLQVLEGVGVTLPLDAIRGMVVIVDADTSKLKLDSISATRVSSLDGLENAYAMRHEFMVSQGLDEAQQVTLAEWVRKLDRSNDPRAECAHAKYRDQFRPADELVGSSRTSAQPRSVPLSQQLPSSHPMSPGLRDNLIRALVVIVLASGALGLAYWGVTAILDRTAPPWVYLVAFVILAAIGGEDTSSKRRGRRRGKSSAAPQSFAGRLIYTSFALVFTAVVCVVLYWGATTWFTSLAKSLVTPVASPPAVSAQPGVDVAKNALRDTDPETFAKLSNPDQPVVGTVNGYPSFTWDYIEKASGAAVRVRSIKIMLDSSGRIVGVER